MLQLQRLTQLIEQRLCLLQIGSIESLGEPAVDRGEKVAGLGSPAVALPEAGERRGLDPRPKSFEFSVRAGHCLASAREDSAYPLRHADHVATPLESDELRPIRACASNGP